MKGSTVFFFQLPDSIQQYTRVSRILLTDRYWLRSSWTVVLDQRQRPKFSLRPKLGPNLAWWRQFGLRQKSRRPELLRSTQSLRWKSGV